ncbi:MAG: hypothetical protein QM703_16510 [Gemmatales bacterium]
MQLWGVLLLLVSFQPAGQPASGSVVLSASRSHPYVGEVIELKLTISSVISSTPLTLVIPGLTTNETWRFLFESWLHQSVIPPANALPLRWHGRVLYAPHVRPGQYELRWKTLIDAPRDEENPTRRIGPAQVGTMTSNPLTLEIQRPPLQSPSTNTWDLGVGNYRITAQWLPAEVVLGEETLLSITVEGSGAVEAIAPPPLRTLPGWESDRFLLEALPTVSKNGHRLFRFLVRPRQLRATAPPLFIRYFDPQRGTMVTNVVTMPALSVLPRGATSAVSGSTIEDARKHLPEFRRRSIEERDPDRRAGWLSMLLWIPLAWSSVIIARSALQRLAPNWLLQRRWRHAEKMARLLLDQSTLADSRKVRSILASYLTTGLARPVDADWESLSHHAPHASLSIQLILTQLQQCDFGPDSEQDGAELRSAVQQVFQTQEIT